MSKVIVYDFDKTLTTHDTLFGFFIFNEEIGFLFYIKSVVYIFLMVLAKLNFISNQLLKEKGIHLFLSKLPHEKLKYKFENYHEKITYNFLFKKINFKSSKNTYVVSASFKQYLDPIFPKNVKVIGSSLHGSHGDFKLKFNCYGDNKLTALKDSGIGKIDVLYTDSISDLSLASISNTIIVIKNNQEIVCHNLNEFKKVVE